MTNKYEYIKMAPFRYAVGRWNTGRKEDGIWMLESDNWCSEWGAQLHVKELNQSAETSIEQLQNVSDHIKQVEKEKNNLHEELEAVKIHCNSLEKQLERVTEGYQQEVLRMRGSVVECCLRLPSVADYVKQVEKEKDELIELLKRAKYQIIESSGVIKVLYRHSKSENVIEACNETLDRNDNVRDDINGKI